jgi:DNA-binding response OmpR family regulator
VVRILLVEDDALLGDGIKAGLTLQGEVVDWVEDGILAELALKNDVYDAVVLDLALPRLNGLDLLRQIRKTGNKLPVVVITAQDAVSQRISGLDAGADDYLVKPFAIDELAARLRAVTRRRHGHASLVLSYAGIELESAAHTVRYKGKEVSLSAKEFTLLQKLMERGGRVLSRAQLDQACYGGDQEPDSNAVEVYIYNLRQKLDKGIIKTIRGAGYLLVEVAHE